VLPDSNVYGPVLGLWSPQIHFTVPSERHSTVCHTHCGTSSAEATAPFAPNVPIQTGLMRQRICRCHAQGAPADNDADMKPGGAWLVRHWLVWTTQ
jgi:hypothetical protein